MYCSEIKSRQIFLCIGIRGVSYRGRGRRCEYIFAKVRIHISKMIPQNYFPVFARVRTQAQHAFAQQLIPQDFFPACIGFVPEGKSSEKIYRSGNSLSVNDLLPDFNLGPFSLFSHITGHDFGREFYGRVRHYLTSNNCPKLFSIGNNRADIATQPSPLRML